MQTLVRKLSCNSQNINYMITTLLVKLYDGDTIDNSAQWMVAKTKGQVILFKGPKGPGAYFWGTYIYDTDKTLLKESIYMRQSTCRTLVRWQPYIPVGRSSFFIDRSSCTYDYCDKFCCTYLISIELEKTIILFVNFPNNVDGFPDFLGKAYQWMVTRLYDN